MANAYASTSSAPPRRELFPGFFCSALSLGGAPLGGIDRSEALSILRVAEDVGISLVDTSSAYGLSESVISSASVELSVATKFGNPNERNGDRHDYSPAHCVDSLYASIAALRGKKLACLQLHSPPEHPSPLLPALVDLLESLRVAGKFGAWGASVHSDNGGQVALAAGAQMLQVPPAASRLLLPAHLFFPAAHPHPFPVSFIHCVSVSFAAFLTTC